MKRNTFLLPVLVLLSAILSNAGCKKTEITSESPNISTQNPDVIAAKSYFETNYKTPIYSSGAQTESQNHSHSLKKTPEWNKAYTTMLSTGLAVVIPMKYDKKTVFKTNLNNQNIFDMEDASRLVIYKDHSGGFHTEVVSFYPDSAQSDNSNFSGIIKSEDWNGNFISEYKYSGSSVKMLQASTSTGNVSTNSTKPPGQVGTNMFMIVQTDYYMVTYTYVVTDPGGGYYNSQYLGSDYTFIDVGSGTGGGGSLSGGDYSKLGGGGSGTPSVAKPTTSLIVYRGDDPISNVAGYIKCFNGNLNATYSVTLCVDQPNPGTRDPYSSYNNGVGFSAGHTFLVFQQNVAGSITSRAMGLYPSGNVTPVNPTSKGSLNNDEGHSYSVSLTIYTNGAQFMNMLNACANGNNVNYNLNTNNCSTWALSSLAAGGVNISTTPGSWPFGGGDDPGDLGQDIRTMSLSTNMILNPNGGYAGSNIGTCP